MDQKAWWAEVRSLLERVLPAIGCPKPEFEFFSGGYMDDGGEELYLKNLGYGISAGEGLPVLLSRTEYYPGSRDEPPSEEPVNIEEMNGFAMPAEVVKRLALVITEDRIGGVFDQVADEQFAEELMETARLVEEAQKRGEL